MNSIISSAAKVQNIHEGELSKGGNQYIYLIINLMELAPLVSGSKRILSNILLMKSENMT
jgi:hypothetical protein